MIPQATGPDAPVIEAIVNAAIRDTAITFNSQERSLAEVTGWTQSEDICLVAEIAGRVAGFIRTMPFRSGPGYARCIEHTIILEPVLHGRGAGRALIEAAADRARALGKAHMIACVSSENPAGAAFHAAMGFARVGQMPGVGYKFGREMDLLIFQKRI